MNKHTIIGNLTRDPVAGNTQSGVNYCQFTVAVDRRYKPQNGPDAEYIRDHVREAHPDMGEIRISSLGVVIGAHTGPGLLAIFYLCGERTPE